MRRQLTRAVVADKVCFGALMPEGLVANAFHRGNAHVLLMERAANCLDPQLYRLADLEPTQVHLAVVKGPRDLPAHAPQDRGQLAVRRRAEAQALLVYRSSNSPRCNGHHSLLTS